MRTFLKSKKGVTILEGLIALTLLALVATGTFAVLLSTSRKSSAPDIREEMMLAVEKASQQLQMHVYPAQTGTDWRGSWSWGDVTCETGADGMRICLASNFYTQGLCGDQELSYDALATGKHDIDCLLPPICDKGNSSFYYKVTNSTNNPITNVRAADRAKIPTESGTGSPDTGGQPLRTIEFHITCNGYTL